jgi:hypothetical protein
MAKAIWENIVLSEKGSTVEVGAIIFSSLPRLVRQEITRVIVLKDRQDDSTAAQHQPN